jgi:hypothetical protein
MRTTTSAILREPVVSQYLIQSTVCEICDMASRVCTCNYESTRSYSVVLRPLTYAPRHVKLVEISGHFKRWWRGTCIHIQPTSTHLTLVLCLHYRRIIQQHPAAIPLTLAVELLYQPYAIRSTTPETASIINPGSQVTADWLRQSRRSAKWYLHRRDASARGAWRMLHEGRFSEWYCMRSAATVYCNSRCSPLLV